MLRANDSASRDPSASSITERADVRPNATECDTSKITALEPETLPKPVEDQIVTDVQQAPPTRKRRLKPVQYRALALLAAGRKDADVARELRIHRSTINRWRMLDPLFSSRLNRLREGLWANSLDRIRFHLPKAVTILSKGMQSRHEHVRLRSAIQLLKIAGTSRLASKIGPDNIQDILFQRMWEHRAQEYPPAMLRTMMPPDSQELEEFHQMLLKHIDEEEQAEAAAEAALAVETSAAVSEPPASRPCDSPPSGHTIAPAILPPPDSGSGTMKTRESGMPDEPMWASFFDPPRVLQKLGLTRHCRHVVEFGCGYGTFTIPAARIAQGPIHAIDIESDMVEAIYRKVAAAGLQNVWVKQRDLAVCGTGVEDGDADYVMMFNILHAEEPLVLLREAFRVLRKGGLLAIMHWKHDPTTPRGPSMEIRPRPEQCRAWALEAGFGPADAPIIDLPPYHYGIVMVKPGAERP
jgi:SAM-dependent methyltransferase